MDLIGTYEPLKLYKDDYFPAFSDLGALRHLEIDGLYELASFGIGVSSLESFVLRWVHEDISSLSGFTNLHTLKLVGETNRRLLGSREPVQQTTLSLPRLKSLYMQWLIRGIQDVQFNTPKLECLDILCRYSQLRGKANYAKVQTEHVSWRVENDWKAIDTNKKITFELQSILLAYPDTSYFTFPSIFKEMVVELLQEPIIDSPLSAALRAVTFEGPSGDRETLMVEELW
ncbi:hypothetical protein M408DRAFT_326346 [Serendipita vermifera MAFF 305830]|uniref:Uncharacterized protein n=1 Tax=Serendipita vermifera MAFF 305830 TaxID=933852 RepID=A0A0C3BKG4_SERVB|nr:hypothetical protein M408DRAFT_326346 [Serendipita vermifera MAFF 305830]